jgi:hypothetical protein
MGKPLVRFREGQEIQPGYGRDIVAPPRKQVATEKTNFLLQSRKAPVYSKDQIETFPFPLHGFTFGKIVSLLKTKKTPHYIGVVPC